MDWRGPKLGAFSSGTPDAQRWNGINRSNEMSRNPTEPRIEIACAGCGRTQRVRLSTVIACDGYTSCSLGSCKQNPDFRVPTPPEGSVCVIEIHAAGAFSGWTIREASEAERQSVARARAIRDRASS